MARLLFISDNFLNESLGIMYLSAYLKANQQQVKLTLLADHESMTTLVQLIAQEQPDLIGFSVMTPQVETFRPVVEAITREFTIPIIWGGAHCTFMPEQAARENGVKIICVGEGEEAVLELMQRIDAHQPYHDVPNLWIRYDGQWIKNDVAPLEANLDKYPFPDRELYYDKYPFLRTFGLRRLITQRGCPYNCSYCFEPAFKALYKGKGKFVRSHSVDYVMADLKQITQKYPTKLFHFSNDSFNLNRAWVEEFARRYPQEVGVPFTCNVSVPNLDEDQIMHLKQAGCVGVAFGLESGVEQIRMEILNKKIRDVQFLEAAQLLRKHRIPFLNNVLIGVPAERLEDALETMSFNKRIKPLAMRVNLLKVYKGTGIAEYLRAHDMIEAEGEFTYKVKDIHGDHEYIKHLIWAGMLFIKIPFLINAAKPILQSPFAQYFKSLVVLSHIQDVLFYKVPLWQSLLYFWHSRKVFLHGISGEQKDRYVQIDAKREVEMQLE